MNDSRATWIFPVALMVLGLSVTAPSTGAVPQAAAPELRGLVEEKAPELAVPTDMELALEKLPWAALDVIALADEEPLTDERCHYYQTLMAKLEGPDLQRPGVLFLQSACASAQRLGKKGDELLEEAIAASRKQRQAQERSPGESHYRIMGGLDTLPALIDEGYEEIAQYLEVRNVGQRLRLAVEAVNADGVHRFFMFDETDLAARVTSGIKSHRPEAAHLPGALLVRALIGHGGYLKAEGELALAKFLSLDSGSDNTERILGLLRSAAAMGQPFASLLLGARLVRDEESRAEGIQALREASEAGLIEADAHLALLCEAGIAPCTRDEALQFEEHLRIALPNGAYEYLFAKMRADRESPLFDAAARIKLLRKGADLGDTRAMVDLARAMESGVGLRTDPKGARKWYARAVRAGNADAAVYLAQLLIEAGGEEELDEAIELLERATAWGDPIAASELGRLLGAGIGVPVDKERGVALFRYSAEEGDPIGQNNYGVVLRDGDGVARDEAAAAVWFQRSLLQGYVPAAVALAFMHADGRGVPKDEAKAFALFEAAARDGNIVAARELGDCYWFGKGVTRDRRAAVEWYRKGAEGNDIDSSVQLAMALATGDGVAKSLSEARALYVKAAEAGSVAAMLDLGGLLRDEDSPIADPVQGLAWIEKAAAMGDTDALNALGWAYEHGEDVAKDPRLAFNYYSKCEAAEPDGMCLNNLGRMYFDGIGTPADHGKGVALWQQAHELGSPHATCNLAEALRDGKGIDADPVRAAALILESADAGNPRCQLLAGLQAMDAEPEPKWHEALKWIDRAIASGDPEAEYQRAWLLVAPSSGVRDVAQGEPALVACAEKGRADCERLLAVYYQKWATPTDKVKAGHWLERAHADGDATASFMLGARAYFGLDEPRDIQRATAYLKEVASIDGRADVWLALIERAGGKVGSARDRLLLRSADGNLLAKYWLSRLCRETSCPETVASMDSYNDELWRSDIDVRNNVAWFVVVDPHADASDGAVFATMLRRLDPSDLDWTRRDTLAAALARAGQFDEACREQNTVLLAAKADKATPAGTIDELERRKLAYCAGQTWNDPGLSG